MASVWNILRLRKQCPASAESAGTTASGPDSLAFAQATPAIRWLLSVCAPCAEASLKSFFHQFRARRAITTRWRRLAGSQSGFLSSARQMSDAGGYYRGEVGEDSDEFEGGDASHHHEEG